MRWLNRIPGHLLIILLLIGCLPDSAEPTAPPATAVASAGEPVAPPAATATSSPTPAASVTPAPSVTPPPTRTIAPTLTPGLTFTPAPSADHLPAHSLATRTGVAAVDEVLALLQAGDREALLGAIVFQDLACTNETGMGGPPKCWGGGPSSAIDPPLAEGSLVAVFPVAGAEGMWVFGPGIDPVLDQLARVDGIYAVYALYEMSTQGMLKGAYGLLLTTATGDFLELRVGDGIVGLADSAGWWTPADLLANNAAELILPPPE